MVSTGVIGLKIIVIAVLTAGSAVFANIIAGFPEPWMAVAGMVHYQVHNDPDTTLMGLVDQVLEILKRAVIGVDGIVVGYIVLVISGRGMDRHQPNAVKAHLLNVIQLSGNTVQIADTVVIGIIEAMHKDLIPVTVLIIDDVELKFFLRLLIPGEFTSRQRQHGKAEGNQQNNRNKLFHIFLLNPSQRRR